MMYSQHSSLAQLFGDDSDGFRSGLDDDTWFGHGNLWWSMSFLRVLRSENLVHVIFGEML
jgi:hypothetical protein